MYVMQNKGIMNIVKKSFLILLFLFSSVYADQQTMLTKTAESILSHLKSQKTIAQFMGKDVTFIYHEDNRCMGSSDGSMKIKPNKKIDEIIKLKVTNTDNGWLECEKKSKPIFTLELSIRKLVSEWDRFEISNVDIKKKTVNMVGSGESDYMVFTFEKKKGKYLVSKVGYFSEDPG